MQGSEAFLRLLETPRPYTIALLNVGALLVRIGFWGLFYSSYTKEPQNPMLLITAPILFKALAVSRGPVLVCGLEGNGQTARGQKSRVQARNN